jgi:hypothetical protein
MFRCLLVGVLASPTAISPQLRDFIGVRMEITEAAVHSPSRASDTAFGDALAPLISGLRWLSRLAANHPVAGGKRKEQTDVGNEVQQRGVLKPTPQNWNSSGESKLWRESKIWKLL